MKGIIVNYVGISPGAELIFFAGPAAALDNSGTFLYGEIKRPQTLILC
jgi:hypothetical protein